MSENLRTPAGPPRNRSPVRSPSTRRPAALRAAPRRWSCCFSSCLAVLGAVLLAPVLPRIEDAFAGTAGSKALTPIVLTAPALVIGLTATGRRPDRRPARPQAAARRRLVVYAIVGTAPVWLPSLQLIVVSRVLVGLTEAAIMTCCTTLLADYFHGSQRERYFGLQVVFTRSPRQSSSASAAPWARRTGATPFWLYAVSLPLARWPLASSGGRRRGPRRLRTRRSCPRCRGGSSPGRSA